MSGIVNSEIAQFLDLSSEVGPVFCESLEVISLPGDDKAFHVGGCAVLAITRDCQFSKHVLGVRDPLIFESDPAGGTVLRDAQRDDDRQGQGERDADISLE
ncbi:MAG TPA: hypothetical protein VEJ39_04470 [Candidatus Acidoferrales bacterium]|nr:hypothetical protein [Candidatus Acidoferrales bacterium]